ncbi:MAG: hypothetical protein Ct9H90mP20_5390 [Candidatus Neomarinimicrobiota bacterium]|nr:MAG: hypothetical protein Ct9H90mP20_5390 [Candidatus Neomarinimicrobiota bacterium]
MESPLKTFFFKGKIDFFAETGVMLGKMVKECIKRNLSGVESLVGVPGTLGGALIMNAGAFGGEISNYLKSVTAITIAGSKKKIHCQRYNIRVS